MKKILFLTILTLAFTCYAGFGGSRSSGSFSSSRSYSSPSRSSSSFGGSRSTPSAPIVRPSTSTSRPQPQPTVHTNTVYRDSGSSGNGFLTGMIVGHMMTNNSGRTIVVNGQSVAPGAQYESTSESSSTSFWTVFAVVLLLGGVGYAIYRMNRES